MNATEAILLRTIRGRVASDDRRYTHEHLGERYRHDCTNLIKIIDGLNDSLLEAPHFTYCASLAVAAELSDCNCWKSRL